MKIFVKVKVNSKNNKIEKAKDNRFLVSVKAKPERGKANKSVIDILSNYFDISKSEISLISGYAARNKIFEIKRQI